MDGSRCRCLFFSLANILESYSLERTRLEPSARCPELSPQEATVRRGESEATVPVEEVRLEETLIIYPGAKIPLDGEVLEGNSTVNQAPITGESMPVRKGPGDTVFAGSINQRGSPGGPSESLGRRYYISPDHPHGGGGPGAEGSFARLRG